MRSSFVIAVNLSALRFEIQDMKYFASRGAGLAPEELKKLDDAVNAIGYAESQLKAFRMIKKTEDLPEDEKKSKKK